MNNALRQSFHLVLATGLITLWTGNVNAQDGATDVIEEIIVTANKREQSLADVAASVTVLTTEQLEETGAIDFEDYLGQMPGIQFSQQRPTSIRGIATDVQQSSTQLPVGIYWNDIPMSDVLSSFVVPTIDPFDLARVEALRGPQGALYGSASLGGAINYVTNTADPSATAFRTRVSLGSVADGGTNYSAHGMANFALVDDVFGIRLVGGTTREAGYIDNIGTGVRNENDRDILTFRGAATWNVNERVSLELMAHVEEREQTGRNTEDTVLPATRTRETTFEENSDSDISLVSLTGRFDLGPAMLTSLSGVYSKSNFNNNDNTASINPIFELIVGTTFPRIDAPGNTEIDGISQEFRLSSQNDKPWQWMFGALYFEQEIESGGVGVAEGLGDALDEALFPGAGDLLAPGDVWFSNESNVDAREIAFFGDVTFPLSDKVEASIGGRYYNTDYEQVDFQGGFLVGEDTELSNVTDDSGFNPRVSLSYRPTEDAMWYVLASRGYRFGGVNNLFPLDGFDTPDSYVSDSIWNYEIGTRQTIANGKGSLNAVLFYIDWTDIQLGVIRPDGFRFTDNVGDAESTGVEINTQFVANDYLGFELGVAYTDAKLSSEYTGAVTVVPRGTALPGTPEWQTFAALDWNLSPVSNYMPRLRLSHQYVGESTMFINSDLPVKGDYQFTDVTFSLTLGDFDLSAFASNIGDERGILSASRFGNLPIATIKPRTFGVMVTWQPEGA